MDRKSRAFFASLFVRLLRSKGTTAEADFIRRNANVYRERGRVKGNTIIERNFTVGLKILIYKLFMAPLAGSASQAYRVV